MQLKNRIAALFMAIVLCFGAVTPAFAANERCVEVQSISDYRDSLIENGYPAMSTEQFMKIVNAFNFVTRLLTGQIFIPQKNFQFTLDEMFAGSVDYVFEETGFDLDLILGSLPETNQYSQLIVKAFDIDTEEMRKQSVERSAELANEGKKAQSYMVRWFGVWLSVIDKCQVQGIPVEGEDNLYEVVVRVIYKDGGSDTLYSAIFFNPETGAVYGRYGTGMLGLGYDFSVKELVAYSPVNIWMRNFGFCLFYDIFSYSTPFFNYHTRRYKFDYDGLEWMIQIWKGNYLISNGGEVGLYNRKPGSVGSYYNCANDEQMMEMTMDIYHGDELLLHRGPQVHWWLNGFKMSDTIYIPASLRMEFSIVMKDEAMVRAFCNAIKNHYRRDATYTVDGLTVSVVW